MYLQEGCQRLQLGIQGTSKTLIRNVSLLQLAGRVPAGLRPASVDGDTMISVSTQFVRLAIELFETWLE